MHEPKDPVALYGLMRSAAWRCGGVLASAITTADDDDVAMAAMLALRDEVRAIDPHDRDEVIAAIQQFNTRYELLASGWELAEQADRDAEANGHEFISREGLADQRLWLLSLIATAEFQRRNRARHQWD